MIGEEGADRAAHRFTSFKAGAAPRAGIVTTLNAPRTRGIVVPPSKGAGLSLPDRPVELHAQFLREWPVRDQFGRGTCVAFAVMAMLELHEAVRGGAGMPKRRSEHLLYRLLRKAGLTAIEEGRSPLSRKEWEAGATTLEMALEALRAEPEDGAEPTTDWGEPYRPVARGLPVPGVAQADEVIPPLPLEVPALIHGWKRPEGAAQADETAENAYPDPEGERTLTELFCAHLLAGCPVAAGFPTFPHDIGETNWTLPRSWRSGRVPCPQDEGAPRLGAADGSGHVVCVTGFVPDPDEPSGGWFVFRNSWGLAFGGGPGADAPPPVPARGYGLVSATHVDLYCWEFLTPAAPR